MKIDKELVHGDENIDDEIDPFSTFCYWDTESTSIDENCSETELVNIKKKVSLRPSCSHSCWYSREMAQPFQTIQKMEKEIQD